MLSSCKNTFFYGDPDPFLAALDQYGLPRSENRTPALVD